ncbi:hypothetical protein ASPACDRAFT_64772 [Aspergillus aculeatus ATCC 16872]|uniref:Lipase-like C-terminal domain-containing protein n=1 Tax=Aspergillus aculeatus (strain ATCC 16872 / CBS 172.66 / WB 5094) TaxID=690307 RepID=A0A1L9WFG2_ASPA1|nr:uncharacterized protein ASPACDRAFT_64772 [Aspergillus aculeatus ATCC 16872]OJJ94837.1 hypothetical protein ASPACDRAFT_64772 [Aspergillus aculeatus ATCC 16872]
MAQSPSQLASSGVRKLNDLVTTLESTAGLQKNTYPIVLVPGFTGFGEPLFGSINYWGGFEDLASELQIHTRIPIILPRIGPISSNWERACEFYCQLHAIQRAGPRTGFDTRGGFPATNIQVDYGKYINLPPGISRSTKQAVVLGEIDPDWQWNDSNPVHMICHSQGGNTVRLLIELLSGRHARRHPSYFASGNQQELIKSVVTLGTPYLGTTITSVVFDQILRDVRVDEVISRLVVSASLNPTRFVDLQLGQWGFTPNPGESFLAMHNRLQPAIFTWWNSNHNGIRDNGIDGITRLNQDFDPRVSEKTYYFTMSFDATRPFPKLNLSPGFLVDFPTNPIFTLGGFLYPGPGNIVARGTSLLATGAYKIFTSIPGSPSDVEIARWAVDTFNYHTGRLGYQFRIPRPGRRIPRDDMLPILAVFSLGMSGVNAPFGLSEENDGVVDTASMRGPKENEIKDSTNFNTLALASNRGVYWHLGVTEAIDHADQVGVFTAAATFDIASIVDF